MNSIVSLPNVFVSIFVIFILPVGSKGLLSPVCLRACVFVCC